MSEAECPYCKALHGDMWEIVPNDDDVSEIECDCGKTFEVRCSVMVRYPTRRRSQDCDHKDSESKIYCDHCELLIKDTP